MLKQQISIPLALVYLFICLSDTSPLPVWPKMGNSRLQGLCHRANLVDLKKEAVAGLLLHSLGNTLWIGHSQIITNHLDANTASELLPGRPVILVKWVFNGHHCRGTEGALRQCHPERSRLKTVVPRCCGQVPPTSKNMLKTPKRLLALLLTLSHKAGCLLTPSFTNQPLLTTTTTLLVDRQLTGVVLDKALV